MFLFERVGLTQLACSAFGRAVRFVFIVCAVSALCAETAHTADGKVPCCRRQTCAFGYPPGDQEQRTCVTPKSDWKLELAVAQSPGSNLQSSRSARARPSRYSCP